MPDASALLAERGSPSVRSSTGSRPQVTGFVFADQADYETELAALLRDRLKAMAALGAFVELASSVRTANISSEIAQHATLSLMLLLGGALASLGVLVFLLSSVSLPLRVLRRLESALLLMYTVTIFSWVLRWTNAGGALLVPSPPELRTYFPQHMWGIYPDQRFVVFDPVYTVGAVFIVNWGLLTLGYSILIPNTWRRCLRVLLLLLSAACASIFVSAYLNPALKPSQGHLFLSVAPIILAFACIGLYGSHKLSTLGRQAFKAQQVGQYVLKQQIGRGGMGEVYLAHHRLLRRPCAVKLIRREQAGSASRLQRFEREVQAMARLTHPNTVEIYDYGRTQAGTFYYAMEYLPGLTTEDLVRAHGPLPAGRAVYLLRQVCRALREAHGAGLIHRDIKPGQEPDARLDGKNAARGSSEKFPEALVSRAPFSYVSPAARA